MAEKVSQGQADKAEAERRTAQVAQEKTADELRDEARSAAALSVQLPADDTRYNPYPNYDVMTLDQLRSLAKERGVEINRDVEKAHLITELRAADSGVRGTGEHSR